MKTVTLKASGLAIGLTFLLQSCGSTVTQPVEVVKADPTNTETDLQKGQSLYENNCGKCHDLFKAEDFDAVAWTKNLNNMQKRAGIDDAQKALIYQYLIQ